MKGPSIQICTGAYLCWAALILLLPLNWLAGWAIAISIHETGHLVALKLCRVPVYELRIGMTGVRISTAPLTQVQELICAAAGPVCSFLPLIVWERLPAAALIGLVQGIFNLIPLYPLDGGRILRAVISLIRKKYIARNIPCKDRHLRVQ